MCSPRRLRTILLTSLSPRNSSADSLRLGVAPGNRVRTMDTFTHDVRTSKPPRDVLTEALAALTGPLSRHRYLLTTQSESGLTFARKYRPWWVWVLMVVTFPIGLLWLLITETATITVV